MADIHIQREHRLGLDQARQMAAGWIARAEEKFDLSCRHEAGEVQDQVAFTRPGMSGMLTICEQRFDIQVELGFLMAAFKERIQAEMNKTLDKLIDPPKPATSGQAD